MNYSNFKNLIILLLVCLSFSLEAQAVNIFKKKAKPAKTEVAAPPKPVQKDSKAPKPYNEVITRKAKTSTGFFIVHKVDNSYFFEIPDSLLGRDLLVVNRISKSAADSRKGSMGYAGDQIGENVIRFEIAPNNKVFIKQISFSERSTDSTGMYFAVQNSNLQPIVASFDIKAYRVDSLAKKKHPVIEVTDFINSDNAILYFDEWVKKNLNIGNNFPDRSYIDTVRSFPLNIEIKAVKTYARKPQTPNDVSTVPLTYELNSSIVLLPEKPMKPRYFDPRVGYFATSYTDFDNNPQGVERVSMITRWRLEPKDEDLEKYKRGELVEPQKPIVFYIDPATPKKWIPYLIQGINDWQIAFEQAGFKNAIIALEAPVDDPNWSIDDARHSAIVYKPSDVANASGPHVHDPRSGEIIETHINWYHNVMKLLHDWYFVQASAIDSRARTMQFDDELMGQLIRFVSSHEVGHTLGLRHNFGSSSTVPVENLRNKTWVETNGHTPSIMDYARFNYVAQPEDNIGETGIFPRIGLYDKWAIEWGYAYLPDFETANAEIPYLNKWIIEKLTADKRHTFGTEIDQNDPHNQNEDLGDNAMLASTYGIKNLQRILPNIFEWTKQDNKDYSSTGEMYLQILTQYNRYLGHVTKNIGGIYSTPKRVEQNEPVMVFVDSKTQKEAMQFLDKQFFTTPQWLINDEIFRKCGIDMLANISIMQNGVINRLISLNTINKLVQNETLNGNQAYTVLQLFDDLKKTVWSELKTAKNIDVYRRNLQRLYVNSCISIVVPPETPATTSTTATTTVRPAARPSDAPAVVRMHLVSLRADIARAVPAANGLSKAHLQELIVKIDEALEGK
ncbi:MAG: zinc-dependent metalloprotease [Paludibacter sp.]|jgi:hypothetical protein|nr:zinc-dependent metalloprotease [Paludibacter sp.]